MRCQYAIASTGNMRATQTPCPDSTRARPSAHGNSLHVAGALDTSGSSHEILPSSQNTTSHMYCASTTAA